MRKLTTSPGSYEEPVEFGLYRHPHFIDENSHAFICLNITNFLLPHKYTQHSQLHVRADRN